MWVDRERRQFANAGSAFTPLRHQFRRLNGVYTNWRSGLEASCSSASLPLRISTFAAIRSSTRGHNSGRQDITAGDIPKKSPKLACVHKEVRYSANCSETISRYSPVTSASFHTRARLLAFVSYVDNLYPPPFSSEIHEAPCPHSRCPSGDSIARKQ